MPGPQSIPFEFWYGDWRVVLTVTALYTLFLVGLCRMSREEFKAKRAREPQSPSPVVVGFHEP